VNERRGKAREKNNGGEVSRSPKKDNIVAELLKKVPMTWWAQRGSIHSPREGMRFDAG